MKVKWNSAWRGISSCAKWVRQSAAWCFRRVWNAFLWCLCNSGIRWLFSEKTFTALVLSALVSSILVAYILKYRRPEAVLVISAFEVPPSSNSIFGVSGKTVSNLLMDEMEGLAVEANRYLRSTSSIPTNGGGLHLSAGTQLEKPTIDVEVEGISLKGILLEWY